MLDDQQAEINEQKIAKNAQKENVIFEHFKSLF